MSQPEYKVFPCIFCTLGFNYYVAGHKFISATYKITQKATNETNFKTPTIIQQDSKKEMLD